MNRNLLIMGILLALMAGAFAQAVINDSNSSNNTGNGTTVFSTVTSIDSPWSSNSIICQFVVEYIRAPVFLILFVIFLCGVAVISGAAFPQWRNYGSQMVLGPIGAALLYIIGSSALRFLLGTSVCGL